MARRMNSYIGLPIVAAVGALWLATPTRAPALTQAPPDQEEPQAGQPRPAELPKPLVIPEAEMNRKNPVPVVPEAIEAGRVTFASQCAMCHGLKGDGRGDLAASLKLKIPDLTTPAIQKKRTDGDWYYIISTGHGQMPGEQRLLPQNRWEMINFMRSLLRPAKTER